MKNVKNLALLLAMIFSMCIFTWTLVHWDFDDVSESVYSPFGIASEPSHGIDMSGQVSWDSSLVFEPLKSSSKTPQIWSSCFITLKRLNNPKDDKVITIIDPHGGVHTFNSENLEEIQKFDKRITMKSGNFEKSFSCPIFMLKMVDEAPKSAYEIPSFSLKPVSVVTTSNSIEYLLRWWMGLWNRGLYCEIRGYNCFVSLVPKTVLFGRSAYYVKLPGINNALKLSELVLFMDSDAFFTESAFKNDKITIEGFMDTSKTSRHSSVPTEVVFGNWHLPWLNTGLILFHQSQFTFSFLQDWWLSGLHVIDQPSIWHVVLEEFQQLVDENVFTPADTSFRYDGTMLKVCEIYGKPCQKKFLDSWNAYWGNSTFMVPNSYEFLLLHSKENPSTSSDYLFHCLFCSNATDSLVFHSGSSHLKEFQKLKSLDERIIVN